MKVDILVMINTFISFVLCVGLGLHFSLRWDHAVLRALSVFFFGLGAVLCMAYLNYIGVEIWGGQSMRTGILGLLLLHLLWSIRREIVKMLPDEERAQVIKDSTVMGKEERN